VPHKQPLKLEDLDGISLRASDAYLAMGRFLRAYFDRTNGKGDLATICSDVEVEQDRMSTDPAALADWEKAVSEVLEGEPG
jgi:hypothetical protein